MIDSIECCGKVQGYKNSTLPGIKDAKYIVINFHILLSEPICMLIALDRTSSTHSYTRVSLLLVFQ